MQIALRVCKVRSGCSTPQDRSPKAAGDEGDLWWPPLAGRASQTPPREGGPHCHRAARLPPLHGRLLMSRFALSRPAYRVLKVPGAAFEQHRDLLRKRCLPRRREGRPSLSFCVQSWGPWRRCLDTCPAPAAPAAEPASCGDSVTEGAPPPCTEPAAPASERGSHTGISSARGASATHPAQTPRSCDIKTNHYFLSNGFLLRAMEDAAPKIQK